MAFGLKRKILLLALSPLLLVLIMIGGLTIYNKRSTERQLLLNRFYSYRTLLESGSLSFDSLQDKKKLEILMDEKIRFAEILRKDHSVIYNTEFSAAPLIDSEEEKDVDDAFLGIETIKDVNKNGQSSLVIFSPAIVSNRIVAVIHQSLSNDRLHRRVREYAVYVFSLMALGLFVCYVLISTLLERIVLKNIYKLEQATIEMQKGRFMTSVDISADDEIGKLARSFEQMTKDLKKSRRKLEKYSATLEKKVRKRTENLHDKNKELAKLNREMKDQYEDIERFNKLMVDRELKMVELKKEITRLKEGSKKT